jgi:hypothetical protein
MREHVHNRESLEVSDRCVSLSGWCPSREAFATQDAARGIYLSRHSVPSRGAVWRLKLSCHPEPERLGQIYLRHRRKAYASVTPLMSLKGSDRYTLRHRRRFSMHIISNT